MTIVSVPAAFTPEKVLETRNFFVQYLGAKITFDCGWYVNLSFGIPAAALQFMFPKEARHLPQVDN